MLKIFYGALALAYGLLAHAGDVDEAVWASAGFLNPKISMVSLKGELDAGKSYDFRFAPTLVVFRGTGWSEAAVLGRARRTVHIYSRCGIAMDSIKLVVTDTPFGFADVGWTDGRDQRIAQATPAVPRPLIYFARYDRDGYYAFTWRKSKTTSVALQNTIWMTRSLDEDLEFKNSVDPGYEVLAHELGHALGDMGHLDDGTKSLMAEDGALLNGDLPPALCEKIRKSELLQPTFVRGRASRAASGL